MRIIITESHGEKIVNILIPTSSVGFFVLCGIY
jgi:hypothetical protein